MENRKVWTLKPETELRCEVNESEHLSCKLLSGTAEIFGTEMVVNKEYTFIDTNIAIFAWYGCVIETSGDCTGLYESDSTPMVSYVNTHAQLEAMRDVALANSEHGPRVMIVGPADHGKSTTARILASYACRLDRTPLYVDLDVGQTISTIPGCIGAMALDKFNINVEEGFASSTGLVFFYGYNSPKDNPELYKFMVSTLADKVAQRMDRDADLRSSGVIINTSGFVDGEGYNVLLHCVQAFKVDVVLVMGHDRLYSSLVASLPESTVTIVKLPRSGGVVQRDRASKTRLRRTRIKEYFYGPDVYRDLAKATQPTFSPERRPIRISSIQLMRAGGLQLSEGMRLIGAAVDTQSLTSVSASHDLEGSILAVLHPLGDGDKDGNLLQSNVAGFVCVVQVDIEQDSMMLLSPCPGALPSNVLLVGTLKWDDARTKR